MLTNSVNILGTTVSVPPTNIKYFIYNIVHSNYTPTPVYQISTPQKEQAGHLGGPKYFKEIGPI